MKNRLRIIRAEMNISQETLAARAGIARQTINAIERERSRPDGGTIAKLVKATGRPAADIFFELGVIN